MTISRGSIANAQTRLDRLITGTPIKLNQKIHI